MAKNNTKLIGVGLIAVLALGLIFLGLRSTTGECTSTTGDCGGDDVKDPKYELKFFAFSILLSFVRYFNFL